MHISLKRQSGAHFIAENEQGVRVDVDGPESVGGENKGVRPMQMVLVGLAGCMSVDILHILHKGRFDVDDLTIDVDATRVDAIPAVFDTIALTVKGKGSFSEAKLVRAVDLSLEKYCSVAQMLAGGGVKVTATASLMD